MVIYNPFSASSIALIMNNVDCLQTINDPVHKTIEIHPLCLKIIDTPEFQRLRDIKQCGISYLVYPSAVHTRFEHSIGVYYLARQTIDHLMTSWNTDEINPLSKITSEERLCVMIAALCHDLGHGPFSHTWEIFVKAKSGKQWHHEDSSKEVFEYLIKKNKLENDFSKYGLYKKHIDLIKDIIAGNNSYDGDKNFLFEIVANKKTNIDVDRWDYMMRDAYFFGIICPLEFGRILTYMRIRNNKESGGNSIEFRDKLYSDLLEMFKYRFKLHRICYQHRVCKIIEQMLIDALNEADEVFLHERNLNLSEAHENIETYLTLSDSLIYGILNTNNGKLQKAKAIMLRIVKRDFYQMIVSTIQKYKLSEDVISNLKITLEKFLQCERIIRIIQFELSMGIEGDDPFTNVPFYTKDGTKANKPLNHEQLYTGEFKVFILSVNKMDEVQIEGAKKIIAEILPVQRG